MLCKYVCMYGMYVCMVWYGWMDGCMYVMYVCMYVMLCYVMYVCMYVMYVCYFMHVMYVVLCYVMLCK